MRRQRMAKLLGILLIFALAAGVAPLPATAASGVSTKNLVFVQARAAILEMMKKSSAADVQYYAGKQFRYGNQDCARCQLGPAVAAAALYRRTKDRTMYTVAVQTMDAAIKQQRKDGGFAKGGPNEYDNTIQTIFFAVHLGSMMTYLGPTLDSGHRALYKKSLARAADVIVARNLLQYYVNGNINLAATVGLGMAWKQTGSKKYQALYEKSLRFTLNPGSGRWKGFGYKVTRAGKLSLGRNTSAYLAEQGMKSAGFDPEYQTVSSDLAATGFLTIGDPRLLSVANGLTNQMMTRVDTTYWLYDTSGGTRHNRVTGLERYTAAAYYVGARYGMGQNLAKADSQVRATTRLMTDSAHTPWPGIYQAWGHSFAAVIYLVR